MINSSLEQGIAVAVIIISWIFLNHRRKAIGSAINPHAGLQVYYTIVLISRAPFFVPVLGHLYVSLTNYKSILDILVKMFDENKGATGTFFSTIYIKDGFFYLFLHHSY